MENKLDQLNSLMINESGVIRALNTQERQAAEKALRVNPAMSVQSAAIYAINQAQADVTRV